jgi:hypothetical protein
MQIIYAWPWFNKKLCILSYFWPLQSYNYNLKAAYHLTLYLLVSLLIMYMVLMYLLSLVGEL